jgi:hypothetical protein
VVSVSTTLKNMKVRLDHHPNCWGKKHVSNHQPDKKHMLVGWIYQKYENNHENNHENNKWLKPPARLVMFHKHSTKTKGFNRNIQSVGDEIDDCRSRSR